MTCNISIQQLNQRTVIIPFMEILSLKCIIYNKLIEFKYFWHKYWYKKHLKKSRKWDKVWKQRRVYINIFHLNRLFFLLLDMF